MKDVLKYHRLINWESKNINLMQNTHLVSPISGSPDDFDSSLNVGMTPHTCPERLPSSKTAHPFTNEMIVSKLLLHPIYSAISHLLVSLIGTQKQSGKAAVN